MRRLSGILLCATFLASGWNPGHAATDVPATGSDRFPDLISTTVVTYSVEKTARRYATAFGINDWNASTEKGELTTWKGKASSKQQVVFQRAVAKVGGLQIELLQPDTTAEVFQQFLKDRGGTAAYNFVLGDSAVKNMILDDLKAGKIQRSMSLRTTSGDVITWVDTQDMLGVLMAFEEKKGTGTAESRTLHFDEKGIPHAASLAVTHLCIAVHDAERVKPAWERLLNTKFGPIDLPKASLAQIIVRDRPLNTIGFGENISKGALGGETGPMSPVGPLGHTGPVQIEILEPLWGEEAATLFLRENGEGIYHIGVDMDGNLADTEAALRQEGYIVDMTGVLFNKFKFMLMYTLDLGADYEWLGPAPGTAR